MAALLLLAGCPGGEAPLAAAVDLEPAAGRRYRFALRSVPGLEQVYEVTEVAPAAVAYEVQTYQGGVASGSPVPLRWSRVPAPAWGAGGSGKPAELRLGARTLACRVAAEPNGLEVWTAVRPDGRPAFPGIVRVVDGEAVVLELVAVE